MHLKSPRRLFLFCLILIATSISLSSCAFGDNADVVPSVTIDDRVMYVAGRYNTHACMWIVKGTAFTRFDLPELPGTTQSWGMDIALHGKNVIMTGCCYNGATYFPVMWVNGALTSLTPSGYTTNQYKGEAIALWDGHVYVALTSNNYAHLWVDGVLQQLSVPAGYTASCATSIAIVPPHVLVGGSATSGFIHACVWLDGQCIVLDQQASTSLVYGVSIHNGHVYAAGTTNGNYGALWIDGAFHAVQPSTPAFVYSLSHLDGVPVMAGQLGSTACMWVYDSGMQQRLSGTTNSVGNGIYIYHGDPLNTTVIVPGRLNDGTITAAVWVNGSPIQLDRFGVTNETEAMSVVFGPKLW